MRASAGARSPTKGLLIGMVITLAAASADWYYLTRQIARLRALQTDLADRNRKDSLQLLRIQNDLNSLGLAMRDMLDSDEPYPLTAWSAQFERVRLDLEDALRREEQVGVAARTPEQRQYLADSRRAVLGRVRSHVRAGPRRARGRTRARRSGCRCRPGRRRLAPPSRGCSSRTTRARNRRPRGCRASTVRSSGRSTCFWPRRSRPSS